MTTWAQMNLGIVPPVSPVKERTADLLYRGKPVLQNVSYGLANSKKRALLQTGAYKKDFLIVKPHV
jgi:hypothetical protein